MGIIDGLLSHFAAFGLGGVLSIARHRITGRHGRIQVGVPGIEHPITLRLGTSDHRVFRDIFQRHEYLFNPPEPPETIVDTGANIGLASIYFANRWPKAKIIAIEPDPENFEILRENVRHYRNIVPIQVAVWKENTMLNLSDPGGGSWAMQTKTDHNGHVAGVTMPFIMGVHSLDRIDLLKMDIEGAEKEVFEGHEEWIDRVGSIAIETHDRFKPGSHAAVMKAARHFKDVYNSGETWFMLRDKMPRLPLPPARRGMIVNRMVLPSQGEAA